VRTHDDVGTRRRNRFRRRKAAGIVGTARIDRRTKHLVHRIRPGDIAIILHEDLDELAAEGLIERGAAAVVNCHRSITGRYPNAGPLSLSRARIPLIDAVGEEILAHVREGDTVRVHEGAVYQGDRVVAEGTVLAGERLEQALARAQTALGDELDRFVANTVDYLRTERDLLLGGIGLPEIETPIAGRDAVVVIRGREFRQDLLTLRGYIADMKPVLIAVDGAADAMIEESLVPDLIIGDMDSVSTGALTCGAEVVVHAYPDGRAPGLERVEALGLDPHLCASAGTSEDIALLLAYEKGADLIVAVGAHDNLVEFLDKGRAGMASTFVVRLRVGPKLVDAKGVNRLYHSRVRTRDVLILVASAGAAMIAAGAASPSVRLMFRLIVDRVQDAFRAIF